MASPHDEAVDRIKILSSMDTDVAIQELGDSLAVEPLDDMYDKHSLPRLVCRALIAKGPSGIRAMLVAYPHAKNREAIMQALWYTARGRQPPANLVGEDDLSALGLEKISPTSETVAAAREAVDDLIMESQVDYDSFLRLIQFFYFGTITSADRGQSDSDSFRESVFEMLTESTIKISQRLISEFDTLVSQNNSEESYHRFLAKHPVFLDPLASTVISKQSLGIEHVTDFVIRRLDNEYIIVEIEKPQDAIFTRNNDFTAPFTHAFGQIIDFHEWIDAHGEYARTLLPEISSPRGMLVIGRRTSLTPTQAAKLKRFCINSQSVMVLTFDDLLERARALYYNLHPGNAVGGISVV